jgi:glutathione peroxidase
MADTAYDFSLERLTGGPMPLAEYAGRPVLIVNTASKCGFTPQYAGLESLWERHEKDGLVVIGVPCNQFGGQEPGGADDIASFCQINYGVGFPMAAKVDVKGAGAHPLFRWLREKGGFLSVPRWNFYKYLIGRDGRLVDWYGSITSPTSAKFTKAIAALIAAP